MDPSAPWAAPGGLLASWELIGQPREGRGNPPCRLCSRHTSSHFSLPGRDSTPHPPTPPSYGTRSRDLLVSLTGKGFPASSPSAPVTGGWGCPLRSHGHHLESHQAPVCLEVGFWACEQSLDPLKDGDQGEPMRAGSEVTSFSQRTGTEGQRPLGRTRGRTCQWVRLGLWGQLLREGNGWTPGPFAVGSLWGWVKSCLVKLRCRQQLGAGWTGWTCRGEVWCLLWPVQGSDGSSPGPVSGSLLLCSDSRRPERGDRFKP